MFLDRALWTWFELKFQEGFRSTEFSYVGASGHQRKGQGGKLLAP